MRISIVGSSGSGKTTLARRVASRLGCDHVELDAIFHQPGWEPLEQSLFVDRVEHALSGEGWVCDGSYIDRLGRLPQARADTIVWLDLPRRITMPALVTRTVRRAVRREELWNGNREPLTNITRWDPRVNVIRWSWVHHHEYRAHFERLAVDGTWGHARVVRLQDRRQVDRWAQALAA